MRQYLNVHRDLAPNLVAANTLASPGEQYPLFVIDNFLAPEQCDALIAAASNCLVPSPVVGQGEGQISPARTSSSCYFAREDVPSVIQRVVSATGVKPETLELPQVAKYCTSQFYQPHFDAFDVSTPDGKRFAANGGQRICTFLMYLNDVNVGGATYFHQLNLRVYPKKGRAVIFFPATLDGQLDPHALHSAEPAVDVKWVSQVWIRQFDYTGVPTIRIPPI